jgi:hypothetical protein
MNRLTGVESVPFGDHLPGKNNFIRIVGRPVDEFVILKIFFLPA